MQKEKIIHITIGLPTGGISTLVRDIIQYDDTHDHVVLSLGSENDINIPKATIHTKPIKSSSPIRGVINLLWAFFWVPYMIYKIKSRAVLSHSLPSCLLSLLGFFFHRRIYWVMHGIPPKKGIDGIFSRIALKICKPISFYFPKKIIYVSSKINYLFHQLGYCETKSIVIKNGINTDIFYQSMKYREIFRNNHRELNDKLAIGWMARPHLVKDPEIFIKAMKIICDKYDNIIPVMAGPDIADGEKLLDSFLNKHDMMSRVIKLPNQKRPEYFYNGIDVFSVTSLSEGGPLTILEALACGTLCTSTNVGYSKDILSERYVSPVGSVEKLVNALEKAIQHKKEGKKETYSRKVRSSEEMAIEYILEISLP